MQAYALSSTVAGVFLGQATPTAIARWLALLLGVVTARALLVWTHEDATRETAIRAKADVRRKLFQHILALGPAYSRAERTAELATVATQGVEALHAYFSQYLPQLAISVLVPATILVVVFALDPVSGLILLLTAPLIPFFMWMIGRSAQAATERQYQTLGRLSAHFLDSLQGLTTLKLFGQSKAQAANISRVCDQFRMATLKVLQVSFLSAFALELIATISTAIIAVEVGLRLLYAQMQFRDALFLLILAPEFYLPLRLLGLRFHAGMAGTAAARRIFDILDTKTAHPDAALPALSEEEPAPPARRLQPAERQLSVDMLDVSFAYPDRRKPALEGLSLSIAGGQHVALVGASGAGKTTLTRLLLGFMMPTTGKIWVNGISIQRMDSEELRALMAWAPQNPHLFNDTIGANICLGRPHAGQKEIRRAASAAHLDEFIESLPRKYETPVGEAGARLSSGQAQRLALARAFLMDAPCLVLDEPTSSLDPDNEAMLEDSLRRLCGGRTVITIAHRLHTVINVDQILVLAQGHIVERGTHSELLALDGEYARLFRSNAAFLTEGEVTPSNQPAQVQSDRAHTYSPFAIMPGPPLSISPRPFVPDHEQVLPKMSAVRRLLGFVRGEWAWVWLSALLGSLTIGSAVGLMGVAAWLISTAAMHPSIAVLGVAIAGVRFFGIARAVFRYLERLASHSVTFRVLRNIRVWFYQRLEPLAPALLMDRQSGDLLARATADVETLENLYVRLLAPPVTGALVAAGTYVFFASIGLPQIALLVTTFLVLAGALLPLLTQRLSRGAGQEEVAVRGRLYAELVDSIQGIADILAFGRASDRVQRMAAIGNKYADVQRADLTSRRRASRVGQLPPQLGRVASPLDDHSPSEGRHG